MHRCLMSRVFRVVCKFSQKLDMLSAVMDGFSFICLTYVWITKVCPPSNELADDFRPLLMKRPEAITASLSFLFRVITPTSAETFLVLGKGTQLRSLFQPRLNFGYSEYVCMLLK